MKNKKILISGAGIAGLTLGYFLKKEGFTPVIIEKAATLKDGGYMIDFFSSGVYVAEKMGIIEELTHKDHSINTIKQYTHTYKKNFNISMSAFKKRMPRNFFNLLRTDIIDVLYKKVKDNVDIRFATSIKEITQEKDTINITFDDGSIEEFDLLIAADGIYSNVRDLTYSNDEISKIFLNTYVAGYEHSVPLDLKKHEIISMITPKRQMMSYSSSKERNTTLFIFHSKKILHLDKEEKIKVLREVFKNFTSPIPKIINQAEEEKDLFFDEVSQIKVKGSWHKGRVALVGDAAYCLTLLSGQGVSMAMTGAYVLAKKLTQHQDNHTKAFEAYELDLRPHIEKMQKKAVKNTASFLPTSKVSLWLRNLIMPFIFSKVFSPFIVKFLGAENYFKK